MVLFHKRLFFSFLNNTFFNLWKIKSANQKAYKFRIVEMKDQKDSYRNDTFDGLFIKNILIKLIIKNPEIFFLSWKSIEYYKCYADR